jgi:hypothetical protein
VGKAQEGVQAGEGRWKEIGANRVLAERGLIAVSVAELFPGLVLPPNFQGTLTGDVNGGRVVSLVLDVGPQPGQFTAIQVKSAE